MAIDERDLLAELFIQEGASWVTQTTKRVCDIISNSLMLTIYHTEDPEPLGQALYSEFLGHTELTESDIQRVFKVWGKSSYAKHFRNLCVRLRLVEDIEGETIYPLAEHSVDEVRQDDPGAQLFDLLIRLPHFARWVEITEDKEPESIDFEDVVPLAGREYKMRQGRPGQFAEWAAAIDRLSQDTSFEELQDGFDRTSAYIWDEYLDTGDEDLGLDPSTVLVLFGTAMNAGATLKREKLISLLDCERASLERIVHEVLKPVGVPLYISEDTLGLALSTELRVPKTTRLLDQVGSSITAETSFTSVEEISQYLQYQTGTLDFVDTPAGADHEFAFGEGRQKPDLGLNRQESGEPDVAELSRVPRTARFVTVPPDVSGLSRRELLGQIEDHLRDVQDSTGASKPTPFEYHLREHVYHTGSLHLLEAPSFKTPTPVGDQYLNAGPDDQFSLVTDLLLFRNPIVRGLVALVDSNVARVEVSETGWVTRSNGKQVDVLEIVESLLETENLQLVARQDVKPINQTVEYLDSTGILNKQGAKDQLRITSKMDTHLKANPNDSRQMIKQAKNAVENMTEEKE